MGSDFTHIQRHFDLKMSRRTRKSTVITPPSPDRNKVIAKKEDEDEDEDENENEEDVIDRRTLKKLIESDGEEKIDDGSKGGQGSGQGSNSLGHHFLEGEKHLPLVKQGEFVEGTKLSGMVSRYIKVLNHLIKIKRDSRRGSRKRDIIRLSTT